MSLLSSWVPIQRNKEASALSHILTITPKREGDLSLSPTRPILDCETIQPQSVSLTITSIPYLLGMVSLHCDNPSVAIGYLEAAVAQCAGIGGSAGCSLEQVMLGYAYAEINRVDDAFEQWQKTPESIYYLLYMAQEELSVGEPLLAERWARWAVRLDPIASLITVDSVPVNAHTALGAALARQNKWQDAFDAYSAGIGDMAHPQPYITTADIALFQLNDPHAAEVVLEAARKQWPDHMWVNIKLGDAYIRQKKTDQANQLLEAVYQRYPEDLAPNLYLGMLRYKQARFEESVALLAYVLRHDKNQITGLVYFGLAQHRLGNWDDALQALQRASSLSPHSSWVNNALISVLEAQPEQP